MCTVSKRVLRSMNNSGVGRWRAIISQLLQRRLSDSWPSLGYLSFLKDLSISNRYVQSPKVYQKTDILWIEVVSNQRFFTVSVDKSSREQSRAIFLKQRLKKRNLPFPTWKEDLWMGFQCKQGATIALERRAKSGRDPFQVWTKHCQVGISQIQILKSPF